MKIGKKMEDAINKQINAELYSAYLYLSMSAYFESTNFKGFAGWMKVQAGEEVEHSMKFMNHINERGGRVILDAIDAPKKEWKSPLDAFEEAYNHELEVTSLIDNLVKIANEEKDNAASVMLHWFTNEQIEEEDQTGEIVEKLKLIKDSPNGLFMLDKVLGERKQD
ncbi:ferritin [Nanoarchaeota archaeon]